jgi:uncharacterized membrane protein YhaH (DUF805 family)
MDWGNLLFSYQGRINRAKYWLAVLVCSVAYFVAYSVAYFLAQISGFTSAFGALASLLPGVVALVSIVVAIKRLHDRNRSGWWLLVSSPLAITGMAFTNVGNVWASNVAGIIGFLAIMSAFAVIIWTFVELFCLPGTVGPNQYGSDPLAPPAQAPTMAPPPPPPAPAMAPPPRPQMDWGTLLFGYQGRIDRAKYWLAVLVYSVAYFVAYSLAYFVAWIIGFSSASNVLTPLLLGVVALVSIFVTTRRLHDRNKSGWWLLVFCFASSLLAITGIDIASVAKATFSIVPIIIGSLFLMSAFAVIIWAFVELFCLPGTVGPNRYGPDLLAPPPPRPQ